jgi:hypothetical protein
MLTESELEQHCRYILAQRRIKNKIVILCEGVRANRDERLSPQIYSRMEELPDANFYKACIPRYWTQRLPQFFNCGDRQDTLNTYFKLLEIQALEPDSSYLSPNLLYALVDVDLCPAKIQDYNFSDTEDIFHDLYDELCVRVDRLPNHHIWVTGFKHKEAYFLNPDLQQFFDEYTHPIAYQDRKLELDNIYQDTIDNLNKDKDLKNNLVIGSKRIQHCQDLALNNIEELVQSFQLQWKIVKPCQSQIVFALLAISNSKSYWKQVVQSNLESSISDNKFREALSLQIAREFYANQNAEECSHYHLPCFFQYLHGSLA